MQVIVIPLHHIVVFEFARKNIYEQKLIIRINIYFKYLLIVNIY